ncbi:MAG: type II toxin-antitoxin system HicA family toxin [Oscillospiraceae bacterium]|nr:type II toxin-antitoxin system HicA family toxin [Oscillospiraceae bacterium]
MNKNKLLEKIYNNYKNVRFHEFITLVEAFGFVLVRKKGSHSIYKNYEINRHINLQPKNGLAKPYQIKQFFEIVQNYNLDLED